MKQNYFTLKSYLLIACIFFAGIFALSAQVGQAFSQRHTTNIRGELIMLANNVVSKDDNSISSNDDYNGNENNNNVNVEYIDIDSSDDTFSSSSSRLSLQECAVVRYAGLYWSAIYPFDRGENGGDKTGTPIKDYKTVKLAVPGANYIDVPADDEIYYGAPTGKFWETSYVCYADVTDLITPLADPNGDYFVGNVRASQGRKEGGSGGGWVLVIIYEDPNMPGKYISTFDGYVAVSGTVNQEFSYNGFKTIPTGPVRARLGVGTLEGDIGLTGDKMSIKADGKSSFTNLSNAGNPQNNFFNSNITVDGYNVTTRNTKSENTLGFDADIFQLSNNNNSVIDNNETGLTVRVSTSGDGFGVFLNTMSIDIIQPTIKLTKIVEDNNGNDITGDVVDLGQEMYYVIKFQNVGNDNAEDVVIRDALPINVDPLAEGIELPASINGERVSFTYDENTHSVSFNVPDNHVEIQDPEYEIKLKVKVVDNCYELRDACSNIIQNLAYASYTGEINKAIISDDPSVADYDACDIAIPGSTNFLADIDGCKPTSKVTLCGGTTDLVAGDNFETYQWYRQDAGGNWIEISGETNQIYTASTFGEYKVVKTTTETRYVNGEIVNCLAFDEFFTIEPRSSNPENPFADQADKTEICSNDGSLLPLFFLCGVGDERALSASDFNGASSFEWQKLDEGCADETTEETCPTRSNSCTWTTVSTNQNFTLREAGEYRLVVTYDEKCFTRYPFKAYQNSLDPIITPEDIICDTNGKIDISGVGTGYEFSYARSSQAFDPNTAIWQTDNEILIDEAGVYTVYIRQANVDVEEGDRNPCLFKFDNIEIEDREFSLSVIANNPLCYDGNGSISVKIDGARADYSYWLMDETGSITIEKSLNQEDNHHIFSDKAPGTYLVEVLTEDGCTDSKPVTIVAPEEMKLTAVEQDIACDDGTVTLTVEGGTPEYSYAVWSYVPATGATAPAISYGDIDQIAPEAYFDNTNVYAVAPGAEGTYVFLVSDDNNCNSLSNTVTVEYKPLIDWELAKTDLSCFQSGDGKITVNHGATNGYNLTYSLEKPDGSTVNSSTGEFNNLPAGRNYKVTVTQTYGNQSCTSDDVITLTEPDRLTASAGVSKLPGCDAFDEDLAEVRITNPLGGTPPYEYSFNGDIDSNYSISPVGYLAADTHTLYVRDSKGCTYAMEVEIPDLPEAPEAEVDYTYNCDGSGNITVTPDIPEYEYTYDVDGNPITGDFGDEFTYDNLSPGEHKVTIHYNNPNYVSFSELLFDDFGKGINTKSLNVNSAYIYESQNGNDDPNGDADNMLDDGEYVVTSDLKVLGGQQWRSPSDGQGEPHGRYLAINIGETAGAGGIIYEKEIEDVITGKEIIVNISVYNLLYASSGQYDPDIALELVNAAGTIVSSNNTGPIDNDEQWHHLEVKLPAISVGENLTFRIKSYSTQTSGNDIAIDGLKVYQTPEKCDLTIEVPIAINGEAFKAELLDATSTTCNGYDDGTIVFTAENFNTSDGFQYSTDNINWSAIQTTSPVTISGLEADDYTIYVRDARDVNNTACKIDFKATVPEPTAITVSADVIQQMTCDNSYTAIIEASAGGGNGNFEYQLEDNAGGIIAPYQTENEFTVTGASNAGDYVIRVKDEKECVSPATASIEVTAPEVIDFSVSAEACYDGKNGDITVTVNAGNDNYEFSLDGTNWLPADPSTPNQYVFKNRTPDNYTVYVRDGYGCGDDKPISIEPRLTASVESQTDITCLGEADGQAVITVNNAQGDYSYTGDGKGGDSGISSNTFTVSDLAPGDYIIEITDAESCSVEVEFTISQPTAALTITDMEVKDITCNTDGSVTITAEDGWGDYEYKLTRPDDTETLFQASNEFTGLTDTSGNYTVTVKDAGGCEVTDTFTLDEIALPDVTLSGTDLCYDSSTGGVSLTATVAANTGTPNFSYVLTNTGTGVSRPSQTTNIFNNVTPGIYTVTVTDANGCPDTSDALTIEPELTASSIVSKGLDCSISPDGEITVTINGGYPDYSYEVSIDGAAYTGSTNLPMGSTSFTYSYSNPATETTYKFRITDNEGCIAETGTITIQPITSPEATPIITDVSCSGNTDGIVEIDIDETKGASPYTISFDGSLFTSKSVYSNLSPGPYNFVVRDGNGCEFPGTATVGSPVAIDASIVINPMTCDVNDTTGDVNAGSFEVNITQGGVAPFTYELFDSSGNPTSFTDPNGSSYDTPNTSHTFVGINIYADYIIRVTDSNGCEFIENPVRMPSTPFLSVESETVAITCSAGATMDITASGGNGDYSFEIFGPGTAPDSKVNGPGVNEQTATFSGLNPGQTYIFEVTDNVSNCVAYHEAKTTAISSLAFDLFDFEDVSCNGSADGEVSYAISGIDPAATELTYTVLDKVTSTPIIGANGTIALSATQTTVSGIIPNIPPGTYVVLFEEIGGTECSLTEEFFIREPSQVKIESVSNINANCNIGSQVTVRGSGGTGPYTFAFVENGIVPTVGDYTAAASAELDPVINTEWDVYVMDNNGCTNMVDVSIILDPSPEISGTIDDLCAEEGKYSVTISLDSARMSPYQISINGQPFQNTAFDASDELQVADLHSGSGQNIRIKDVNGCIDRYDFDIYPPLVPSLTVTAQPVCTPGTNGAGNNGEITINASGGTGDYGYEIYNVDAGGNPTTAVTGAIFFGNVITNVPYGDFIVRVTDNLNDGDITTNCSKDVPVSLEAPTPVAFTLSAIDVKCNGGTDGSITVELDPANDNPPYSYDLYQIDAIGGAIQGSVLDTKSGTDNVFRGHGAGFYRVRVTSDKGCELYQDIEIDEPELLEIAAAASNSCGNEGTYAVTVTLDPDNLGNIGTAPYQLRVNGALRDITFTANQYKITGLNAGDYSIEIIDDNGCNFVINSDITITPLDFKPDVTTLLDCEPAPASNAVITLSAFQGSGDYSFTVVGPNGITGSGDITLPSTTWDGAAEAGDYVFTITDDAVGCTIDKTVNVPETKLPKFTATAIDALCNATNTGKIRVNAIQNGLTPLTYSISPNPGGIITFNGATNTFENVPAGPYTITAQGTNSCTATEPVTVGEPLAITGLNATVTQFVCSAGTNTNNIARVSINGKITGGTGDYVFEFIYTNGNPAETITQRSTATEFIVSNTLGGNVEINVYDDNGCTPASENVTIDPFVAFDEITATPIQPTCNGADGSVLVETTLVNSALGIDNDQIQYHIASTDGSTNSTILDATDASPLDYQFDNLDIGSYIITVTNLSTGCELKTTAVLTNPNTFDVEVTKIQDVECFGSETGIVDVNLIDDTYTVPFSWTIYNAQDDTVVKSGTDGDNEGITLFAGTYYVEVTQINTPFCTNRSFFNIKQPENPLAIDADISKKISCLENGEITVSASGGYGFYEFAMVPQGTIPSDADFSDTTVFTDVIEGTYDIYVRDEKGCDEVYETLALTQPEPIVASAIQGDIIECDGEMTATISVINVSGGRPAVDPSVDYLFILNRLDASGNIVSSGSPQTDAIFTGLPAGSYSVTVMDNYGCDVVTNPVTITQPEEVKASLGLDKGNTCTTGAILELVASGGTGTDYEYSTSPSGPWTPFGANTNDNTTQIDIPGPITAEQSFQFYVRDANLCISRASNSVTISPVRPLEITPTVVADVSCYNEATGYIKVDVTGGLGNYLYTLMDVSGNVVVRPQQEENTFDSLPAGVYYVQVDSEDCMEQLRVEILQGQPLTSKEPVVFNPMCSDDLGRIELELEGGTGEYQYAISPNLDQFQSKNVFEDLEPGTYTIIAQDSKGCNPYVYKREIVAPNPIAAKADILNQEYCVGDGTGSFELNIEGGTAPYSTAINTQDDNAFVQDRITFDGLAGGETYVVFVRDANGCQTNVIVTMDAPVNLDPQAQVAYTCIDNLASNEVEIILAQDGLTDVIYSMDGGPDQFENKFTNIPPGSHTVTVSYYGCQRTVDFTVDTIEPLNMAVGQSNINEFTMEASGGTPPYEYYVDGVSNGTDPTYVIRQSGVYEVKVIDANGCERIAQIEMEFVDVDVPNVFTPDGDNNNDTWTPKNTIQYPNIITKIYDRYGRVVAELRLGDEWDGRYNGTQLPTGDYWYVIKLNGDEDDREFVGHFTLYR
ncbi:T9SS type B sorting domain-containing protein [Galbibacter sp. PAP.153]|uniref:T9SS type B sorting domain-containing protein n=1 Tax=Galbibacter sp. PAP.153 TaxID=3104623 RepID=UPI00300A0BE7